MIGFEKRGNQKMSYLNDMNFEGMMWQIYGHLKFTNVQKYTGVTQTFNKLNCKFYISSYALVSNSITCLRDLIELKWGNVFIHTCDYIPHLCALWHRSLCDITICDGYE